MMRKLVIATSNQGKFNEFSQLISDFPIEIVPQPEGIKVIENGKNFKENARLKACTVANQTGCWALADDSGLSVAALQGAPGVHSARYAKTDLERINKIIHALEGISDRRACFTASLCLASPENKILIEVEGHCEGLITHVPRGTNGFGYDPIFQVNELGMTFAEMSMETKKVCGHRGKAFSIFQSRFREII